MAKRNLTVLFGADTSKLTKALGGLRKKISGAFSGMLSLKGMAAAGIGGFGISQAVGLLMNLSPAFANALLKMKEPLFGLAAAVADTIAPWLQSFADYLTSADLIGDITSWWHDMKDGFGIVVDFLGGVPGMLKDGFLFITGAFSDIYDASLILLKQFDQMVSDALGKAAADALNTDAGRNAFGAAVDAAAGGEGTFGQIKAAGFSLMNSLLSGSVRTDSPGETVGASDR